MHISTRSFFSFLLLCFLNSLSIYFSGLCGPKCDVPGTVWYVVCLRLHRSKWMNAGLFLCMSEHFCKQVPEDLYVLSVCSPGHLCLNFWVCIVCLCVPLQSCIFSILCCFFMRVSLGG